VARSDATRTATSVLSMGQAGSGPGQLGRLNGIDVDAAGNAYVVDAGNDTVHVFGPTGSWRFDVGDRALFPGDLRGIAVDDGTDRVYVANSQAGTIEVFDTSGTHLTTFGSLGTGPGQFRDGARQLTLTPDGHLWAADYADRRVEEFAADGAFLGAFPDPPQLPDPAGFASARGVAVDPVTGDVLVADNWNQRVSRFAPDGTPLQTFGQRGSFLPDGMNYPRSIAVDPTTRNVWVANYEGNPDLVVYTPGFDRVVRVIHVPRFVNDIDIVGGLAYLLVRRTGSVMVYDTATGALVRTCCTNLGYLRGIAIDAATGAMWLTSDGLAQVYVVSSSGSLLRTLPVDGRAWGATIAGDAVYVADSKANEIIAFDRTTYARLGQFGTKGFLPGQLAGPSGIASDAAGRLYVVEDDGARVDVFAAIAPPQPETVKPSLTMDAVAAGTPTPLVLTGAAADATGVLQVEVLVQDTVTGRYWNARTGTWGNYLWNHAVVWGPSAAVRWRFTATTAIPGRAYAVRARSIDALGLISRAAARTVTVG
jgi:tripartite motif-containing protein 71